MTRKKTTTSYRGGENHPGWKGGHWNRGSLAWANRITKQSRFSAKYGNFLKPDITGEALVKLYEDFSGVCPICGKTVDKTKGRQMCLDHCHKTGKVRGFICHHCNAGLGWYENRTENIHKYLNNAQ